MTMAAGVALAEEDNPAALRELITFLSRCVVRHARCAAAALTRAGAFFPRRDETAEEMLARTFIAPLSTGVAAIDRCAARRLTCSGKCRC